MMIHEITALAGADKKRKRVGRGTGSGGKRSGRGQKGAGSRSGNARKTAFEGGQMPYFRRLRKSGFTNAQFATHFWIVNLGDIVQHDAFKKGGTVDVDSLIAAGLIRDTSRDLKILGDLPDGKLGVKLEITASRVSDSVRKAVTDAGGSVTETGTRRDRVRGVDRNAEDRSPKNLTKKLKRAKGAQAVVETEEPAEEDKKGKKKK